MDDTVFNFMQPLLSIYNKTYNDTLTLDQITEYSIEQFIKIPPHNFFSLCTTEFFCSLCPFPGVVDFINTLHSKGSQIYFLTAGHPYTAQGRHLLLNKYFDWYKPHNLILCKHKWLVQCDLLFDDYEENLKHLSETQSILKAQPWNLQYQDKFITIHDWKNITVNFTQ